MFEKVIASSILEDERNKLYKWALGLAWITIIYNLLEGIISVGLGISDETLALFGFGVDSFVEVISGIGILHMVFRIRKNENENPDEFEKTALKITGTAFYVLTAGLLLTATLNIIYGAEPETTFWGIIISIVSIVTMKMLIDAKVIVGKKLNSQAILSDAGCTKACMYLSIILLISSVGYELTGIGGIDSIGAILIAVFSFREGKEAFAKSRGISCCDSNCKID